MQTSIFLAKLVGLVSLAGGVGLFANQAGYRALAQEFLASRALIYLSGLLTMTGGVAIVLSHNIWSADWRVVITLLGWLAAIGGAARIVFPGQVRRVGEAMLDSRATLLVGGAVWLVMGAILTFVGFSR